MLKASLILLVAGISLVFIVKTLSGKATGPFTKQVQLYWSGEDGGLLGKLFVIMPPVILISLIWRIF